MVEQSPHYLKDKGSSAASATGTERETKLLMGKLECLSILDTSIQALRWQAAQGLA